MVSVRGRMFIRTPDTHIFSLVLQNREEHLISLHSPAVISFIPVKLQNNNSLISHTYKTTRLERFANASSGMRVILFRANVMACREDRLLRPCTGTSVRELSSSQRCRKELKPEKLLCGTL